MRALLPWLGTMCLVVAAAACNGQLATDVPHDGPDGDAPRCEGDDPSRHACDTAAECGQGEDCVVEADAPCRPSACGCTEEGWLCTADCQSARTCAPVTEPEPDPDACTGPNPASNACTRNEDCAAGYTCEAETADVCAPSACSCDSINGLWVCSTDCRSHSCKPSCAGADPSRDGCSRDEDCEAGEECTESAVTACRPSACVCGDEGWACSEDCNRYHACTAKP